MTTLLNLLSALSLLVWGTHIVRTDILRVYGTQLRRILSTSIKRRSLAFLAGLGVTSLVQSSNATAVIVCSFVAQGLISLTPALTIMLGADVGTALMTGILSFDLSWLSPLLISGGVVVYLTRRHNPSRRLARAVLGLGLILLALKMIGAATQPIMHGPGVKVLFSTLTGDVTLDALIGAMFAMMTYSSLATVLSTATLASSGIISLKVALCLTIGANLGSGILALLGTANQNVAGRRVALGSMLFRLSGAIIALPIINHLELWITLFTHDLHLGVVAFHVLYNSVRCLLLLPLVGPMSRLCTLLLPKTQKDDESSISARHLDLGAIGTPSLALVNASRETLHIGDLIEKMLLNLLPVIRDNNLLRAQQNRQLDHHVDKLYTAVKMYLARVSREELNEKEVQRWTSIITMTINLKQAGDIIERIIKEIENKKIAPQHSFSEAGMREVSDMHARLVTSLQLGLSVFLNSDLESAQKLLTEKEAFRDLERTYAQTHLTRLAGETQQSIETSSLHLDLISDMRRMHSLFCASAYPVLDDAGLLRKSRMKKHEFGRTKPIQSSLSDSYNPP